MSEVRLANRSRKLVRHHHRKASMVPLGAIGVNTLFESF